MKTASVPEYLFKGLVIKHCIRDMEATGLLRSPTAGAQDRLDQDLIAPVSSTVREGSLFMQRAYRLLFVLENVVREFIRSVLYEADRDEWFDKRATASMKRKMEERKEAEQRNQWHTGRNEHPVYYLDFSDLGLLIQNHWQLFKDLLPTQQWALSRLQDAEKSRNVIAHTNILSDEEVARLEILVRDWIRQVQ